MSRGHWNPGRVAPRAECRVAGLAVLTERPNALYTKRGITFVQSASIDFISTPCGTSAL